MNQSTTYLPVKIQSLLEMTYDELYNNTLSAFSTNKRQHLVGEIRITQMRYIPNQPSSAITIKSTTTGQTHDHNQEILIHGVNYNTEDGVTIPGYDVTIEPLHTHSNDLQVKCSCSDFYWRFATWNAMNQSLIGDPPPPYVKKSNRPDVNPNQTPGICKHIMAVVNRMRQDGILSA